MITDTLTKCSSQAHRIVVFEWCWEWPWSLHSWNVHWSTNSQVQGTHCLLAASTLSKSLDQQVRNGKWRATSSSSDRTTLIILAKQMKPNTRYFEWSHGPLHVSSIAFTFENVGVLCQCCQMALFFCLQMSFLLLLSWLGMRDIDDFWGRYL